MSSDGPEPREEPAAHPRCYICRKHAGAEEPPPGGYLYRSRHFSVCHAPLDRSVKGTVLVESNRHVLDIGGMRPEEGADLAEILRALVPSIKRATGAERVYLLATMDGAPHFHLWLVPRPAGGRLRGVKFLAAPHPVPNPQAAAEVAERIRRGLRVRLCKRQHALRSPGFGSVGEP